MSAGSSRGATATRSPKPQLRGRRRERATLDRLLTIARGGHGAMLVMHGEPGVGKTALLDYAVEEGRDFRVVRAVGVEGEMELAFAALQQLCSPILGLMESLPAPQQDALAVALYGGVRGARAGGAAGHG